MDEHPLIVQHLIFNKLAKQHLIFNKLAKPYKHLQSQGHVKERKKKRSTVAASLMLFIACLVVEIIHGNADFFACDCATSDI